MVTSNINKAYRVEITEKMGLSSKVCMIFLLGYSREPLSVSNVEVA